MILVVDNFDSFTWNLVHHLAELGAETLVRRNDEIDIESVGALAPSAIVISPGPKTPADAGVTIPLIRRWAGRIPMLGVCLGHQAIGEVFGGKVVRARNLMHGKTSLVSHQGSDLFQGLPDPMEVMRYHSLILEPESFPSCLEVTARGIDDPSEIHALRHRELPVWGVQFHPESIMTPHGKSLLRNFLGAIQ